MPTYKYRPYYKYSGPTLSQPFREELSEVEVGRRLGLFFEELGNYFDDAGDVIEPVGDGVIGVTTELTEAACDELVKRCLNSLDLFAQKIS